MASIQLDSASKLSRIRFRFAGKAYFRSLNTTCEANSLRGRAESTINAITQGFFAIPPGTDPADFILAGGKSIQPTAVIDRPKSITLAGLFEVYEKELTPGSKEANTRETERTHRRNLVTQFRKIDATVLDHRAIQEYVNSRSADGIAVKTLRLERGTLRMLWNWGLSNGHVASPQPFEMKRLTFPKGTSREPFQTWEQIEQKVEALKRGKKPTDAKQAALWEGLYLDEGRIKACHEHVREHAIYPFIHPEFCFCAYTGARRSEILRSEREDWDFANGTVAIRRKKADTSRTFTLRNVSLHPALAVGMKAWFKRHPGTAPTMCTSNGLVIGPRLATKYFNQALRGSKWAVIPGFHAFRHSLASIMASKGIDQRIINDVLGHSTEDMVKRYRHLLPQKKEEAVGLLFG